MSDESSELAIPEDRAHLEGLLRGLDMAHGIALLNADAARAEMWPS